MRKRINIDVCDFMYLFVSSDTITICDTIKLDGLIKVGDYANIRYISECPDCEEGKELIDIGMYKVLEIAKIKYGDLQIEDDYNAEVARNDLRIRFKDVSENDEILCIIVKNGGLYGTNN